LFEAFKEESADLRSTGYCGGCGKGDVAPYCEVGASDEVFLGSYPGTDDV
jgi:hypothetical protein